MSIPKSVLSAKGSWVGTSKLNLSWLPPEKRVSESSSHFHIDTDSHDSYATVTYTWEYEGKRHEGTMIIAMGEKSKAVEFGWVDSWHQSEAVLHAVGQETNSQSVKVKGSYGAGKEVWGWTIELSLVDDRLTMKMENVTPQGEAEWAVEAHYKRS